MQLQRWLDTQIMTYRHLAEILRVQADRLGPRIALRYKNYGVYHDVTWQQYGADARACAAALIEVGIQPGDRVGLLAENRVEWLIADMGLLTAAAVNVPPHAPLTARQVAFQLADAGVRWIFVSTTEQLEKILQVSVELPLRAWSRLTLHGHDSVRLQCWYWPTFPQMGRRRAALEAELARRDRAWARMTGDGHVHVKQPAI